MNDQITTPIAASINCPYDVSWERVTPSRAKLWLNNTEKTEFSQRGLSANTMKKYAHEMQSGDWFVRSGDSILIATYGGLEVCLNGQHRLSAVVESGVDLNTLVIRNVPVDAFKHVDQGKERTLKDVLDAAKVKHSVDLRTTITNLWKYDITGNPLQNPTPEDQLSAGAIYEWVMELYPELEEWYDTRHKRIRKAARANRVPAGTLAYLYLRWTQEDAIQADQWLTYLEDPVLNTAPCNALALAAKFYHDYKVEIQAAGRASVGHWADVTLLCHQTYNLAWKLCSERSTVRTMKGFLKQVEALGNELPEIGEEACAA